MKLNKAVFLDRDGTINEESEYLYKVEECRFLPGVKEAVKQLNAAGYFVVVVTNQSGVARGYYSESDIEKLHEFMEKEFAGSGARIDGWYYCPHHPDFPVESAACDCRKPLPGMLLAAANELGIDLSSSWMVGDKNADREAGLAAGCRTILVKTGYGAAETSEAPPGIIAVDDLSAAVDFILKNS
ncbi:MAG TPA: D-glycero-beta-D-manno-heptose 1,7-bisphosphate 7-phosphatase [Geobacteraceae bacterium]|nr:D-glycero-beta-D-manno-heptose 1,7-bisphosphate 7-phosphatase [Geobacteraceae bacterium]